MDPARFGAYQVLRRLGEGGMGVVYEATDPALGRSVAIKTLPARGVRPSAWERLVREARAAARLRHPNVVRVHALEAEADPPYLVMELIRGPTLEELLRRAPRERLLALLAGVARGVQHAHEQGVVHRDLKPGNVLVEEETRRAVVTDFGLARDLDEEADPAERLTRSGVLIGTLGYLSPESASGRRAEQGPPADVWSLGVMLYQVLTGKLPFAGGTPVEVLLQVTRAQPSPPSRHAPVSPALEALCLAALARAPAARPSAQELAVGIAGELERAAAITGDALPAPAPRRHEAATLVEGAPAGRRPRRRTAPAALMVAGLAALGGLALWKTAGDAPTLAPAGEGPEALLLRWEAAAPDPAAVESATRELIPRVEGLRAPELQLVSRVERVQARLLEAIPRGALSPDDLAGLEARLPGALRALEELGAVAGLDSSRLLELRRQALDGRAWQWVGELARAAERDDGRPWQPLRQGESPCPELRDRLRLLRAALASGAGAPSPGPALRRVLEQVAVEQVGRTMAREERSPAWRRGALVLLGFEAYRWYWIDRTPSAPFYTWLAGRPTGSIAEAWGHLAEVRAGAIRLHHTQLVGLDPELQARCPESRLLAFGELRGADWGSDPARIAALVRASLGQGPGVLDELQALGSGSAVRQASEVRLIDYVFAVADGQLLHLRQDPARALALGAEVEPLIAPGVAQAHRVFPELAGRVELRAAIFLRDLADVRGSIAGLEQAAALFRAAIPRLEAEVDPRAPIHGMEGRVQLVHTLLACHRHGGSSRPEDLLVEAELFAREAWVTAQESAEASWRCIAAVTLARVLLARSGHQTLASRNEVRELLRRAAGEGELAVVDGWAWGEWSLASLRLAMKEGLREEARALLAAAVPLARENPQWGTLAELSRLEETLADR